MAIALVAAPRFAGATCACQPPTRARIPDRVVGGSCTTGAGQASYYVAGYTPVRPVVDQRNNVSTAAADLKQAMKSIVGAGTHHRQETERCEVSVRTEAADEKTELQAAGGEAQAHPLTSTLGDAAPLDSTAAAAIGDAYGHGFEDVRVHTGEVASRFADKHSAHAVTVGADIAFAKDAYQPGTLEGDATY